LPASCIEIAAALDFWSKASQFLKIISALLQGIDAPYRGKTSNGDLDVRSKDRLKA
jgi:hypothetical protein